MRNGTRSEGYLPKAKIFALLEFVRTRSSYFDEARLALAFRAFAGARLSEVRNSILLLLEFGILECSSGRISVAQPYDTAPKSRIFHDIREGVITRFFEYIARIRTGRVVQYSAGQRQLWLDRIAIPGYEAGIPYLLLEFEVTYRQGAADRHWVVAADIQERLIDHFRLCNFEGLPAAGSTPAQIRAVDERRRLVGEEAEQWVLGFETNRLAGHPLIDQVTQVSRISCELGYDIASFKSTSSMRYDRFIEVKSFSGTPTFYWSRNEWEKAYSLGDSYVIYLVDRDRIHDSSYSPHVIFNPWEFLFESEASTWRRQCEIVYFYRS